MVPRVDSPRWPPSGRVVRWLLGTGWFPGATGLRAAGVTHITIPGANFPSPLYWQLSAIIRTQIQKMDDTPGGLRYIRDRYGSPRGAWDHEISTGWY